MIDVDAVYWACLHLIRLDKSNACMHTAPVKFSPLTFRLVRFLLLTEPAYEIEREIAEVIAADGQYELDWGR